MNSNYKSRNAFVLAGILLFSLVAGSVCAQQKSMTIEELEKYIQAQKEVLAEVKANRDETEKKAQEVRDALKEQEAQRALVEEELDRLCKEQDELKPGSYEDCKSNSSS